MTESLNITPETVPSQLADALRDLVGSVLMSATRYEVNDEYLDSVDTHNAFCDSEGPLVLTFNSGVSLGFGCQPSLNSVTAWVEDDGRGRRRFPASSEDPDFVAFSIDDPQVSGFAADGLPGRRVERWEVYVTGRHDGLPNEQALALVLSGEERLVITYGLPRSADDLRVLTWAHVHSALSAAQPLIIGRPPAVAALERRTQLHRKGVWWVESDDGERVQKTDRNRYEYQHGTDLYVIETEPQVSTLPLYIASLKKVHADGPVSTQEAQQVLARVINMLEFSGDPFELIR